jgi:hypothetical protein
LPAVSGKIATSCSLTYLACVELQLDGGNESQAGRDCCCPCTIRKNEAKEQDPCCRIQKTKGTLIIHGVSRREYAISEPSFTPFLVSFKTKIVIVRVFLCRLTTVERRKSSSS